MPRNRQWRRAQDERKLARVRRVVHRRNQWFREWLFGMDRPPSTFSYQRRVSPGDTVRVPVDSLDALRDYEWHRARMQRDNPTGCSCHACRNPRRSMHVRLKERRTLAERRHREDAAAD